MTKSKFYITTAIDYVNAEPHYGHAYQKIVADALARWKKLQGKDVFFLTGTDEHGKKVQDAAETAGKSPKTFTDEMSKKFQEAWDSLNIKPDRFIRTTDPDHEKTVNEITEKIHKNGDIYKGEYEGYYCTACETYYTGTEAPNHICPIHKKPLEKLKEETYFFRLSKYQKFLLDFYKENYNFILPKERKKEIINRVKEGLKDLSITRTTIAWGLSFPLNKKHVFYVWYEALINYYTAINSTKNKKYWPADLHIQGKDNAWFHTVIWPAMLKSANLPLPISTFNHGFLTFNGQKISKSLGNAISISSLLKKYSTDSIRYFLLKHFPFGTDGDFDEKALIERNNSELADKLGNLVSRVSALAEKYGTEKSQNSSELNTSNLKKNVSEYMEKYELDKALNEIFAFIDKCNAYIQKKKPWITKDKKVLYELAEAIREISILLSPFIPETAEKITEIFKREKIKKAPVLFRKIE